MADSENKERRSVNIFIKKNKSNKIMLIIKRMLKRKKELSSGNLYIVNKNNIIY